MIITKPPFSGSYIHIATASCPLAYARVTYQHVVTSTFHNLINIIIQIYVNYLITKSRHHVDHLVYLWVILEHLICYKIHLKLAKLLFGVWKTP